MGSSSGSFGWRQPVAVATAVVAVATPILGLIWWTVVAPHGDLERRSATGLPAYMTDAMKTEARQRVLVVRTDERPMTYDGCSTTIVGSEMRASSTTVPRMVSPSW